MLHTDTFTSTSHFLEIARHVIKGRREWIVAHCILVRYLDLCLVI